MSNTIINTTNNAILNWNDTFQRLDIRVSDIRYTPHKIIFIYGDIKHKFLGTIS